MLKNGQYYRPLFAADGAGGGGTGEDDKGGAKNPPEGFVSKEEHDKALSDSKQQLDDVRMEILTPEYLEFLENKNKKKEDPPPAGKDIDLEKLSKKEILELAKAEAKKEAKADIDKLRAEFTSSSKDSVQKEVAAFARSHSDYDKYRLIMHSLSLETKNRDMNLLELYDAAKAHVKGLTETPAPKKDKGSEKPGSSSGAHKQDKKYTPQEAADEAWAETVGDGGLPST